MLKALRATQLKSSSLAEGQPEKNHWSQEIWPPSSQDCNPFDSSMWCKFERKVSKKPHNTLASLRAKILEVMANMNREFVIHYCKKFWSTIEAVVNASGDFIKYLCMKYANTLFLKFSVRCIHPNYLFYSFKCVCRVCPNLSSAPCIFLKLIHFGSGAARIRNDFFRIRFQIRILQEQNPKGK